MLSSMPRCSIGLKAMVSGKGTLTTQVVRRGKRRSGCGLCLVWGQRLHGATFFCFVCVLGTYIGQGTVVEFNLLMTKPENAQLMRLMSTTMGT